jgi:hypothetical protein
MVGGVATDIGSTEPTTNEEVAPLANVKVKKALEASVMIMNDCINTV